MPDPLSTPALLRKIASHQIKSFFPCPAWSRRLQRELRASLVRQWEQLDGYAALFTREKRIWFRLKQTPEGEAIVTVTEIKKNLCKELETLCKFDPGLVEKIIEQLNDHLFADFQDRQGALWQITVDPRKTLFHIRRAPPEKG